MKEYSGHMLVSGKFTRTFLLISIISILFSCNSQTENKQKSIDEIGFSALNSIKNNDKQKLYELFDQDILSLTSQSKFDSAFEFYKTIIDKYDFPEFESWKKDRFFYQIDTITKTLAIGLPLNNVNNSTVDYVFEMQFSSKNKIVGIRVNKVPEAGFMPDSEFTPKEEKFNYSFDSLLSIRLYCLPGLNSNPKLSRSIAFNNMEFNNEIKNDFGDLLSKLNKSQILGVRKTTSEQLTTNDLKAIIFLFKDNGKERSLYLISNNIKNRPFEIHVFYVVNATYAYQVNDDNIIQLKSDISSLILKYIK